MATSVDTLYSDFLALVTLLDNEPSLLTTVNDNFRKSILLSAASYFEYALSNAVHEFIVEVSSASLMVSSLVKRKQSTGSITHGSTGMGRMLMSFKACLGALSRHT